MKPNLVVFDFDGTLTHGDSLLAFIRFVRGDLPFYLGFLQLSPFVLCYYLRLISNRDLKQRVLRHFFKGLKQERLEEMGIAFFQSVRGFFVKEKVEEKLLAYQTRGDVVVVVSASCAEWVKPFTDYWQVRFIGTQLQYRSGAFTGNIRGKNCYGAEKRKRLGQSYDFEKFDKKIVFGDSRGGRALAAWADEFTRVG